MSQLPTLIADLALILICAGVMTLLFKKLKQPLVLGYVVAGFLASPHMPYTPSVMDTANIKTWADIGVIFLLFALGLEFSFKKIVKVGGSAIIAACTIIFCMILLGIGVGMGFGWHRMDSLFLGGMIAMSSTTIIYKAFDDLGLRKKQFTGLVLSILILEDILAIVLMVMLSTMAVSQHFEGTEMLESIGKLLFFLILWFVVGIYLIPEFLKRYRIFCCIWCIYNGIYSGGNNRGGIHRPAGETGKGSFWSYLFRIGRYDGGSCNDCRICRTYYSYYFGCYLGTGRFWYIRCYSLRKAFKDGYAMRL